MARFILRLLGPNAHKRGVSNHSYTTFNGDTYLSVKNFGFYLNPEEMASMFGYQTENIKKCKTAATYSMLRCHRSGR